MDYQTLSVDPLNLRTCAVVSQVDLSRPRGNQQFNELFDAWISHQVLSFRSGNRVTVNNNRPV